MIAELFREAVSVGWKGGLAGSFGAKRVTLLEYLDDAVYKLDAAQLPRVQAIVKCPCVYSAIKYTYIHRNRSEPHPLASPPL